ncbi:hypothetical protein FHG87_013228 [Trinorchestia longiramus]|nr:hypothetical protein FHG87_013228 [Trinorchestia longiramus]
MATLLLLVVVGCCVAVVAAARQDLLGLENSPVSEVSSVSGSRAVLPCPLPPRGGDDKTIMVLFYQGASGTPIYRPIFPAASLLIPELVRTQTTSGTPYVSSVMCSGEWMVP